MMTWCIIWSCYSIFQRLFLFLQFKIIWATLMKFSSYDSEYVWVKNELIKKEPGSYDKKICKNLWVNKSLINNLKRSKMQKSNSCMIRHSSKQHFKFISTPSSCIFKFSFNSWPGWCEFLQVGYTVGSNGSVLSLKMKISVTLHYYRELRAPKGIIEMEIISSIKNESLFYLPLKLLLLLHINLSCLKYAL